MTYLDRLAARLDAAGIEYTWGPNNWRLLHVYGGLSTMLSFGEAGYARGQISRQQLDSPPWTAAVIAAEVWREMQEGEG